MRKRNFKSKESYRKWVQHGIISGVFAKTPGNQEITIMGKPHKVKHKGI